MKKETLLKRIQKIEDYGMQAFWYKDYSGSCPCFSGSKVVEGKRIGFWGRCWRESDNEQELYYFSEHNKNFTKEVVKEVKRALDAQEWYSPYTLIKISVEQAKEWNVI